MEHGVRLVEETAAYGSFGTLGRTVPPIAIWQVRDRNTGKLLYQASRDEPVKPKQVVQPAYAYLMNNVLSDNNSRCTPAVCEFGLDSPLNVGRTAAAKTGTTESFTDNWTVGYTPDIVTGVWVGNADNTQMEGTTGITGAAPIWHDFMLKAFDILHLPPKDFPQPPGVYAGALCRPPGPFTTFSTGVYDIYAGQVPWCSIGTYTSSAPIPAQSIPYQPAPVQQAPVQQAPVQQAPVQQAPVQQAPVQQAPVQQAPVQQAPVQQAPVQQAPAVQAAPTQAPAAPVTQQPPAAQPPAAQAPAAPQNPPAAQSPPSTGTGQTSPPVTNPAQPQRRGG
jgi:membrane peptidoglycan carboxypeptidase